MYPKNQSFDLFFNLLTIRNTKISKIFVKQSIKYLPNISSQFFTLSYFTITLLRKSEVKRLHKLENVPNWRLRMLALDREKKKFSIQAIICVEMTGSNWSWSPWQGLETRARPYLLCQDLSSHAFRKCHAMYLTKFGIWLEVSKSQRVRVQASVKVKIDHKRQQNTIFLSARMFKRSFRLLHTGTKF